MTTEGTGEPAPVIFAGNENVSDRIRNDIIAARNSRFHAAEELDVEGLMSSLGRVAEQTLDEIDCLIAELQQVRSFLSAESERVQQDVNRYAQINQSALASVKIINEALGPWKSTATQDRPSRGN